MVADAVDLEPVSSLQFEEMQGDFAKMKGGHAPKPPKSFLISVACSVFSPLDEQRGYPALAGKKLAA
jgi:hypothetical protein